jgi:insertion element IS1 protein InsB
VNEPLLQVLHPEQVEVEICRSEELDRRRGLTSELDEMWSYVRCKANPRWLWHAIDHHTGKVLAYVFGRRQDDVFLKLQQLLAPFGITKFYTDGWGAYERHLDAEQHQVGKENTQKIESKHINLRTRIKRLVRRTLCFSKTEHMHDLVIGLFINRYEFGWCPSTPVMALRCFRSKLSPRLRHHTHRGDWLELGDVILPSPRLSMLWEAFHRRVVGEEW